MTELTQSEAARLLGVRPDDPLCVITRRFRKLSLQHHPDTGGDKDTFSKINVAYQTLKSISELVRVTSGIESEVIDFACGIKSDRKPRGTRRVRDEIDAMLYETDNSRPRRR